MKKGTCTLTGLSGQQKDSVELQLGVETDTESLSYFRQYDEDVTFYIDQERQARLYLRVYPYAEIDTLARPAIYMENDRKI